RRAGNCAGGTTLPAFQRRCAVGGIRGPNSSGYAVAPRDIGRPTRVPAAHGRSRPVSKKPSNYTSNPGSTPSASAGYGTTSFSGAPAANASQSVSRPVATATATAPAPTNVTHDMIAKAAYLRWQRQGGDAYNNWIEAEKELRAAASASRQSQQIR